MLRVSSALSTSGTACMTHHTELCNDPVPAKCHSSPVARMIAIVGGGGAPPAPSSPRPPPTLQYRVPRRRAHRSHSIAHSHHLAQIVTISRAQLRACPRATCRAPPDAALQSSTSRIPSKVAPIIDDRSCTASPRPECASLLPTHSHTPTSCPSRPAATPAARCAQRRRRRPHRTRRHCPRRLVRRA